MTNEMRWYEDPAGGNKLKNTPSDLFDVTTDDMDRRMVEFYRDSMDCSYPPSSPAYTGADMGFPVGDLNWFPDMKAMWEAGEVPVPPLEITVDGEKDEFYTQLTGPDNGFLQIKSYAFNNNGIPTSDTDLSAKVWTAWDDQSFYLYEEVTDDTVSCNGPQNWSSDCIELKFDPQPTDSVVNSIFPVNMTALGAGPGTVTVDSLSGVADADKQYARKIIPGGYALEFKINWPAITSGTGATAETITPEVGNVFGLAICNHDNDGRPLRKSSVTWAAAMLDAVWNTPKYLGTVKFLDDHKLQYIPKNNMTGLTNKIPYDGTPFYMRVDGLKDPFYQQLTGPADGYLQIRSYAYNDNGKPVDDADISAKVWAAWDEKNFYLYEEVRDDTLSGVGAVNSWESYLTDGLELKFDPQPTDSVVNSVVGLALTALGTKPPTQPVSDSLNAVPDSMKQWIRTKVSGANKGYILEMAIDWRAIMSGAETITPAVDNIFGMAICQHDNDGHSRQASIEWAAVLKDAVWNTPKDLGTVKFLADHKLDFIAQNAMTGAATIIPYDGSDFTGVEETEQVQLPEEFGLKQNYPNPFNPTTTISYDIPKATHVRLSVFDMLGREVAVLVDGMKQPGSFKATFDGKQVASGIYFYKMEADSKVFKQKMVLIK